MSGKKKSELEIRKKHGGAIKKHGKWYCSVHPSVQLTNKGECFQCIKTDRIVGAEMAEVRRY